MAMVFCCASAAPAINEAASAITDVAVMVARAISRLLPLFMDLVRQQPRRPASCIVLTAKPPRSPDQAGPDGVRRSRTGFPPRPPAGLEKPAEAQPTAREPARSRCSVAAPSFALRLRARPAQPRFSR